MELLQHDRGRLIRRVPWTSQEDDMLRDYVNTHGDQQWDTMARNLGLGRSGNSCRLRWYNYLKPDIVHGNITDQEMLTILTRHSEFGNQWSRIAQHLPRRTDNEIKNFWNTRVKKEAKLLNLEINSEEFLQIMTTRLLQRIQAVPQPAAAAFPPLAVAGGSGGGGTVDWSSELLYDQELGNLDFMWTTLDAYAPINYA